MDKPLDQASCTFIWLQSHSTSQLIRSSLSSLVDCGSLKHASVFRELLMCKCKYFGGMATPCLLRLDRLSRPRSTKTAPYVAVQPGDLFVISLWWMANQVSCSSFRACTKLRTARCCGSRRRLIHIWRRKRLTSSHKISRDTTTRCRMHLLSLCALTCDSSQAGFTKLAHGTWSRALVASSWELKVPFILRGTSAFLSPQALSKYIAYSYMQL